MLKDNQVVLFDKGSHMFYGDRFYDLATVVITCYASQGEFPLLKAFMEGYGEDFMSQYQKEIQGNVILRAFERFPNRFESQSGEVLALFLRNIK